MESAQNRALPIQNLGQILLFSTVFVLKKLKIAYVTIRLKNPHGVYILLLVKVGFCNHVVSG